MMIKTMLKWTAISALAALCLWLIFAIYATGHVLWAAVTLAVLSLSFYIYLANINFAYRYLFPGIAAMLIFVAFPLFYTVQIGFTNYSSNHLLSRDKASAYLLEQTVTDEASELTFSLHADGKEFRLMLSPAHEPAAEQDPAQLAQLRAHSFISPPLALLKPLKDASITMLPLAQGSFQVGAALPLAEVIKHRKVLQQLRLALPDGSLLRYASLREFGRISPLWTQNKDGSLTNNETHAVYQANTESGYFERVATGKDGDKIERLQPGFKANIGFDNYRRMVNDNNFRGPFFKVFLWTVAFAGLTVLCSTIIGMTLAVMLNWEALRFRTVYRTLLFLPYAVPGFISILVFKGLFNQNFGEINVILNALFGIKPAWFAEPYLAQIMLLIVNTWLGYPYIMVLCSGLIKTVPADLYEASAIAGAKPLTNFFKITAPLIIKPLTPLLISAFAFNFNNFVVIALLTDGRPDFLNTKLPAGTTDILVSYTYRIAFKDSGQNFGLAAAISTVIFLMVAAMALAQLKIAKVHGDRK